MTISAEFEKRTIFMNNNNNKKWQEHYSKSEETKEACLKEMHEHWIWVKGHKRHFWTTEKTVKGTAC